MRPQWKQIPTGDPDILLFVDKKVPKDCVLFYKNNGKFYTKPHSSKVRFTDNIDKALVFNSMAAAKIAVGHLVDTWGLGKKSDWQVFPI